MSQPAPAAATASATPLQAASATPLQATSATPLEVTSAAPLQTTTGGSPTLVLAVFVALALATLLSIYLAVRLYRGYRAGGGTGMALLGIGLVCLTTVPMVLRLVLANVPDVAPTTRAVAVTASQLLGLLLLVVVIYGRR